MVEGLFKRKGLLGYGYQERKAGLGPQNLNL